MSIRMDETAIKNLVFNMLVMFHPGLGPDDFANIIYDMDNGDSIKQSAQNYLSFEELAGVEVRATNWRDIPKLEQAWPMIEHLYSMCLSDDAEEDFYAFYCNPHKKGMCVPEGYDYEENIHENIIRMLGQFYLAAIRGRNLPKGYLTKFVVSPSITGNSSVLVTGRHEGDDEFILFHGLGEASRFGFSGIESLAMAMVVANNAMKLPKQTYIILDYDDNGTNVVVSARSLEEAQAKIRASLEEDSGELEPEEEAEIDVRDYTVADDEPFFWNPYEK